MISSIRIDFFSPWSFVIFLFGTSKLFIQEVLCYSQLCCSYEKLMIAFSSTENRLILQKINKEVFVQKWVPQREKLLSHNPFMAGGEYSLLVQGQQVNRWCAAWYRLYNKDCILHKRNVPTKTACPQWQADPMPCPLSPLCHIHPVPRCVCKLLCGRWIFC